MLCWPLPRAQAGLACVACSISTVSCLVSVHLPPWHPWHWKNLNDIPGSEGSSWVPSFQPWGERVRTESGYKEPGSDPVSSHGLFLSLLLVWWRLPSWALTPSHSTPFLTWPESSSSKACGCSGSSMCCFTFYLRCGRGYRETMLSGFKNFQCVLLEILRVTRS